jgi:hypothetical protein
MRMDAPRVFLSYSRRDGATFAQKLRDELGRTKDHNLGLFQLLSAPLSLWRDIDNLDPGSDWWSQIEETLRSDSVEHFVLLATPDALESNVIKREVRLARQEGVQISPIMAPGYQLKGIPRRFGQVVDLLIPEQRVRLIRALEGPSKQPRVPMMAEEPLEDFVNRPREFEAIKASLLNPRGDVQTRNKNGAAVAITAALKGAGGYGKTTLAQAIAHDDDIQDAFVDGVLWVTLGENPNKNLIGAITDLIIMLEGDSPSFQTVEAAASRLAGSLGERRYLLVIDDVWRTQDLRSFLRGGRLTSRLITTRNSAVLPDTAIMHLVDEMAEVDKLLCQGLTISTAEEHIALEHLARVLKGWAQLAKLVNARIRARVSVGSNLLSAVETAAAMYANNGPLAFDDQDEHERTRTINNTIRLSIDEGLRDDSSRANFLKLAVLPEEVDIKVTIAEVLWQVNRTHTEESLIQFFGLSLLQNLNLLTDEFRLHDNVRYYLLGDTATQLKDMHRQFAFILWRKFRQSEKIELDVLDYCELHLIDHFERAGCYITAFFARLLMHPPRLGDYSINAKFRKSRTMDVIINMRIGSETLRVRADLFSRWKSDRRVTKDDVIRMEKERDEIYGLKTEQVPILDLMLSLLNQYEYLAYGIRKKELDERLIILTLGTTIISSYENYFEIIRFYNERDRRAFEHLIWLVGKIRNERRKKGNYLQRHL